MKLLSNVTEIAVFSAPPITNLGRNDTAHVGIADATADALAQQFMEEF